ncbi:hypothetical protein M409DRAFT_52609 [Zasmidium cellare ATCC 36951]|uniref:Uncharacterized protein n=1 Tax=Zasmidium cellare ATCC 36951 TaxID=1080233 RepID=A0A6A6CT75_ZASCE|nr:uncharacterized protein M409DRAFT_52609 [Zasmidium cellare ATCC 36951]KAF2169360.1 hypothetical protein M409DRAFT_52609 [Zasmidium cellare ATCC 36951]
MQPKTIQVRTQAQHTLRPSRFPREVHPMTDVSNPLNLGCCFVCPGSSARLGDEEMVALMGYRGVLRWRIYVRQARGRARRHPSDGLQSPRDRNNKSRDRLDAGYVHAASISSTW